MSGEPAPVTIPRPVLEELFRHARAAFPEECCGWLEGTGGRAEVVRPCANAQDQGDHPIAAARTAESAYVIAGDDLLALNRSLSSARPALVIYHSHPNGRAYFSDTDKEVATSPWGDGPAYPVQQLVIGIDRSRVAEAALFAWSDASATFVEVARFEGGSI